MFGATVPKATVYEYCDTEDWENKVRFAENGQVAPPTSYTV